MRTRFLVSALALLALAGCTNKPATPNINEQATLTGQLPYNPLAWKVIASSINQRKATMSTLYGNDLAIQHARTNAAGAYPAGSVLALATWAQRDDPHWFGARIPSTIQSVEFVTFSSSGGEGPAYARYQGSPLSHAAAAEDDAKRMETIVSERAAFMP